jgi:hypothetical protein
MTARRLADRPEGATEATAPPASPRRGPRRNPRRTPPTRGTSMTAAERRAFRAALDKPGGTHTPAERLLLVRFENAPPQLRAWTWRSR